MIQVPPFIGYFDKRRQHLHRSVQYNDTGQWLDIWRPKGNLTKAPVLVWIPGGAWAIASRFTMQGHALLSRLVDQGWICLSIDYRTAPHHRWPRQLEDASAALAWARANVEAYGGDPEFVAVAGASAGGHLATLTGLAGLADVVVSLYGSYDWQSTSSLWRRGFMEYVQNVVVGRRQGHSPDLFAAASPLALALTVPAPPTMIVHGTRDHLIGIGEARRFHRLLLESSTHLDPAHVVRYLEVPSGHGFDLLDLGLCTSVGQQICSFLDDMRSPLNVAA